MKTNIRGISGKKIPVSECVSGKSVRPSLFKLIQADHPDFKTTDYLSLGELNHYRDKYISDSISKQLGEITELEKAVLNSLADRTLLSGQMDDNEEPFTTGQKIADKVAKFGGSWTFILLFGFFLHLWMLLNVYWLANTAFDPYPFILLNLILSFLAAVQAPIIMMSQNQREERDRQRAKNDYMINLKSELEIRILHEKIDHLTIHQQQELLEIQKVQIEMMDDILQRLERVKVPPFTFKVRSSRSHIQIRPSV